MMNKILWHAVSVSALIRSTPDDRAPVLKSITNGTWLGVVNEMGEWIYVVGTEAIGWVLRREITVCNSHDHHIHRQNGEKWKVGY